MPIDAAIPLGVQPVKIEPALNRLAGVGEAMKIGEMQRGIETQNQLRNIYSQGVDLLTPEGFQKIAAIDPATAIKLRADALQGRKLEGDISKNAIEIDQKKYDLVKQRMSDLSFNPSDSNIKAHLEDGILRKEVTPQQAQQTWQAVSKLDPAQRKNYFTELGVKAETRYQADVTKRGQDLTYGAAIRGQNLSNSPEIQGAIAKAKAEGTEYGKSGAQANIALPGAVATGEEAIRKVDELVGKAPVVNAEGKVVQAGTKPHAGFGQSVGAGIPGLKYVPGTSAADFNARLNEIQGGAFLQAFNTLKGGGSITETEGTKATAAINRMSTAQSEKEFNTAAREYQQILRTGIERAKIKAQSLSSGGIPTGRQSAAPASGEIDFNSLK